MRYNKAAFAAFLVVRVVSPKNEGFSETGVSLISGAELMAKITSRFPCSKNWN